MERQLGTHGVVRKIQRKWWLRCITIIYKGVGRDDGDTECGSSKADGN